MKPSAKESRLCSKPGDNVQVQSLLHRTKPSALALHHNDLIESEMEQSTWRVLVERYAIRAREFSDAVAALGRANLPPAECGELFDAIEKCKETCLAAAEEIDQYVKQRANAAR